MHPDFLPMNAATLMDRVFDLYKNTFKIQIAFSLIIGIISSALMMILGILMVLGMVIVAELTGDIDIVVIIIIILLGILPLALSWMYLSASGHILISKQAFYGEPVELPLRDAVRAFGRVISAAVAYILLSAPWLILLAFIIFSTYTGYGGVFNFLYMVHPLVLLLIGLAYSVLYVIYSNLFALSVPVAIFERRIFFATVTRSFQLIKGDFWRILGLRLLWMFLVFLFSYSAQGLAMAVFGIAVAIEGNIAGFGAFWAADALMSAQLFVSLLVGVLVGPMEGIMTALIYFNQKIKKDGLDIEIGISRLKRGIAQ